MREILFRGQDIKTQKWVEGYLYIRHNGVYEVGSYNKDFNIERCTHEVIPETVGQYTGLTDKNGNKIFEGDILRAADYPKDTLTFSINWYEYGGFNTLGVNPSAFEAIGNIHDNTDLLEDEQ